MKNNKKDLKKSVVSDKFNLLTDAISDGSLFEFSNSITQFIHSLFGFYLTRNDIEISLQILKEINPKDHFERALTIQLVIFHTLGLKRLCKTLSVDQKLGLKSLEAASKALILLEQKRVSDFSKKISIQEL